ncbi:hypothetical protein HHI36_020975 [Cryptolaemus montrouzieri]|uniref:TMC domain-containing protein n=1 Tax=Cryptolaemus montrouzieri TaxID=559131 RepID=A0ABD2NCX5_9CUCU
MTDAPRFQTLPREWVSTANPKEAGDRKIILPEEKYSSTNFLTLWDFKGYFEVSPLFYGWYTNNDTNKKRYRLPLAYFITGLVVYAYSFFATLRKMAENSRMSKLSEKDDECIFSWKLFTAWDYMIGNSEAAHNRVASVVMGFKEALLEEAEKKRESRNWKITAVRIMVNVIISGLLILSVGTVAYLVKRSITPEGQMTFWRRNELTIVMTLISMVFPMLFDAMGFFESYHPRKQLRIQLARIMVLNLLNLYSLIISQFDKIYDISDEMTEFFKEFTSSNNLGHTNQDIMDRPTDLPPGKHVFCYQKCYWNKSSPSSQQKLLVAALVLNSSIFDSGNTTLTTMKTFPDNSSLTENIDYPHYEDYFASNETSSARADEILENLTESPETTQNYENRYTTTSEKVEDYRNSTTETLGFIGDNWREKYNDYLSYILSGFHGETILNLSEITYERILDNEFTDSNIATEVTTEEESMTPTITEIVTEKISTRRQTETTHHTTQQPTETSTQSTPPPTSSKTNIIQTTTSSILSTTTVTPPLPNQTCNAPNEFDPNQKVCEWICEKESPINMTEVGHLIRKMSNTDRKKLRTLCWETMFGQELVKLTVMDLIMTFLSTLSLDFFRGVFIRVMNSCWCWDLEKVFPKYSDFKVAENILHLVNNQGLIWMGLFFSPGLAVINVIKLFVLMYLRAWTVLTCNVPPEVIFRASKSNNFYYALLLMMLFLCVLPVGYAIVWVKPSWYCGPFSGYRRIYHIFTETITRNTPPPLDKALEYIASPGSIIPLLVLLILVIYYLTSLTSSLREANAELKFQLRRERTEERRKMFRMVDRRRRAGSTGSGDPNNPFYKWKKLLGNLPTGKSQDDPNRTESLDQSQQNSDSVKEPRDFFAKIINRALRKSSTSEDAKEIQYDPSDTEQMDSLPHDVKSKDETAEKRRNSSTFGNFRKLVTSVAKRNRKESEDTNEIDGKETPVRKESSLNEENEVNRQESVSSNWSDNIPVITISKTESAECILDVPPDSEETKSDAQAKNKFAPKVKYALKKQSTEIDEDSIRHFHRDVMKQRSQTLVHTYYKEEEDSEKPEPEEETATNEDAISRDTVFF